VGLFLFPLIVYYTGTSALSDLWEGFLALVNPKVNEKGFKILKYIRPDYLTHYPRLKPGQAEES
jgi:hypothetical protein